MLVAIRSHLLVSKRFKSQMQPVFKFSPVAFPLRGTAPTYHCRNHSPQVVPSIQLSNIDNASRQRMPALSNQTTNLQQLHEPGTSSATPSPGEINGLVDQVALVQNTLQTGATPTLVACIAMFIAQMQAQCDHPDLVLTISSGIGSPMLAARFQDGVWHGYDLILSIGDSRSRSTFGEANRPPMDPERFPRMHPLTAPPPYYHHPLRFPWSFCPHPTSRLATLSLYHSRNPTSWTHPTHATGIRWCWHLDAT